MHTYLREETLESIVQVVEGLHPHASFRRILGETRRRGVANWDRTLRKYLERLLLAEVLQRDRREVGSVYPMELYKIKSTRPRIEVGLSILILHGLNWEIEEADVVGVYSDLAALARAKPTEIASRPVLAGCLEDCVAYELERDLRAKRGTFELLVAMIATKRLDLPYLLQRADRIGIGQTMRALLRRINEVFATTGTTIDGRVFLLSRDVFMKLARQYSASGVMKMIQERGRGAY